MSLLFARNTANLEEAIERSNSTLRGELASALRSRALDVMTSRREGVVGVAVVALKQTSALGARHDGGFAGFVENSRTLLTLKGRRT